MKKDENIKVNKNNKAIKVGALILVLLLAISMGGCRKSLVLTQIIHDQQAQEKDKENDTKVAKNDKNSNQEDEELKKQKETDSKKKTDEKQETAKKGTGNNGTANDTTHDSNSNKNTDNDSDGKKSDNQGTSDGKKKDNSSAGETDNPNARQVYDSNGNVVDIPEKVNSVVVAGNTGIIVQMLGGKGILTGSSSDVTGGKAAKIFSDENISKTATYWSGDGSEPMSSSNFNALIKKKPDVCICASGENSFSSNQIATLKKKNIAYLTVPSLNTYENMKACVETIGNVIGNRTSKGGTNASKLAEEYVDYADELISKVKGTTGLFNWKNTDFNNDYIANGKKTAKSTAGDGKYTLYVSKWVSGAFSMTTGGSQLFREVGYAVAPQGYSNSPISYFMSVAGVCNNGARLTNNNQNEYAAIPLNVNEYTSKTSGGYSLYPNTNESFARAYDANSTDFGVGNSKFPAIVVDSNATKNGIIASSMWTNYGRTSVNGVTDYGFESNGKLVTSYVRGNFDVYVNPCGVTSWTEGSAESVLETIWTAWKFHSAFSESDVKSEIKDFYSKFYRYDLNDSEISSILAGK